LNEWLHPRLVTPLVLWLAHPDCPATGEAFSVGAGHYARVGLEMAAGYFDRDATAEALHEHADEILNSPTAAVTPFNSPALPIMLGGFRPPT
jgi:hypothetical protein